MKTNRKRQFKSREIEFYISDIVAENLLVIFILIALFIGFAIPTQNVISVITIYSNNIWDAHLTYDKIPYMTYFSYNNGIQKPIETVGNVQVNLKIRNAQNVFTFDKTYNITEGTYSISTYQAPNIGDVLIVTITDTNIYPSTFQKAIQVA